MRGVLSVISLVGVALAQDPGATPTVEVPVPAKREIVAPKNDWYSDLKLAEQVAVVRPLVEKHSGLAFAKDPVVRIADEASWAWIVEQEMPKARDKHLAFAISNGFYLPDRDVVALAPHVGYALLGRDAAQQTGGRLILAHELTHVLQQQHFQLCSRMKAESGAEKKLVLRSLTEGFATWVEERVALAEYAATDYVKNNERKHRRNARMEYLRGRDFCANTFAVGGEKAVHEALRAEPMPLAEFVKIALKRPRSEETETAAKDAPKPKGDRDQ